MCKCKAKWWALGALAAVVAVVAAVRGCGRVAPAGDGGGPAPVPSAAERTQSKIVERMADTNYVAGLESLANRYGELSALRAEALRELAAAQAEGAEEQLADNGKLAAAKEKLAKIDEAIEENRRIATDFVAARVRQQGEKGAEAERKAGVEKTNGF